MAWYFYAPDGSTRETGEDDPAVPFGAITAYVDDSGGTPSDPTDWLICDGRVVSQAVYPDLYAAIGTLHDVGGEGAGNFRIPDFTNGEFALGSSVTHPTGTRDITSARSSHTHGGVVTPPHQHTMGSHTHTMNAHRHNLNGHAHNSSHTHAVGGASIQPNATSEAVVTGGTSAADDAHTHSLSGTSGPPNNTAGLLQADYTWTGLGGGGSTSGTTWGAGDNTTNLQSPAVSNSGDILPPHMKVYFIIKAL